MQNQPVRLLLISALPPPAGGVASQTETLLRRGLPGNIAVELVNTSVGDRHVFEPSRFTASEMRRGLRIVFGVLRSVMTRRPHVAHLNFTPTRNGVLRDVAVTAMLAAVRVPVVLQVHSDLSDAYVSGWSRAQRARLARILRRVDRVLALTKGSREWIAQQTGRGDVDLVPNFVEIDEEPGAEKVSGGPIEALFVGGIIPQKGIWELVEAVSGCTGVHLTMIGSPLDGVGDRLRHFVELHGLEKRLQVLPPMPNAEVRRRMAAADVFVLPSHREAFPITVLEAMAEALPVIATRVGAVEELVENGVGGYVIEPGDAVGLARALESLRGDPRLRRRMGRFNRARVAERYAYDVVAARLAGIYGELTARR